MAKIIEFTKSRRMVKLSTEDVIQVVKHYQSVTKGFKDVQIVRLLLNDSEFYIPEEI
ncbi:hypothetical protein J6S88_00825 [bacterium]|nr:hypothetical protein [bacterium]